MFLKNCSECGCQPIVQSAEIGMMFRLICTQCGKTTDDLMSPTSQMGDENPDAETYKKLSDEWNKLN